MAGAYAPFYYGGSGISDITGAATQISDGESIYARIGETKIVSVECNQSVAALTLEVVIETKTGTDVATISNAAITKSDTTASFALPGSATTLERTLSVAVRRTDTDESVWGGKLFVTRAAQGD